MQGSRAAAGAQGGPTAPCLLQVLAHTRRAGPWPHPGSSLTLYGVMALQSVRLSAPRSPRTRAPRALPLTCPVLGMQQTGDAGEGESPGPGGQTCRGAGGGGARETEPLPGNPAPRAPWMTARLLWGCSSSAPLVLWF